MGFLRWMSRDNENLKHRRRQSEPIPIVNNKNFDKKKKKLTQDEEYVQALSKFNDWRRGQSSFCNSANQESSKLLNFTCDDVNPIFNNSKNTIIPDSADQIKYSIKKYLKNRKNNKKEKQTLDAKNVRFLLNLSKNQEKENSEAEMSAINTSSPPAKFYSKLNDNPFRNVKSPVFKVKSQNEIKSRDSISYQTVVNKHGDLVDYALPYNRNSYEFRAAEDETYKNCIDDNLQLLNTEASIKSSQMANARIVVTDLDQSDDSTSNNLEDENATPSQFRNMRCNANDVLPDCIYYFNLQDVIFLPSKIMKTSSSYLYPGRFGNTNVTKVNYEGITNYYKLKAMEINYKYLSYFRHPDISLLMGISTDDDNKINSVFLESYSSTLNNLIHNMNKFFGVEEIFNYAFQILKAVEYVHRNDIIHSNICSHNILLSNDNKTVKLTSFELATNKNSAYQQKFKSNMGVSIDYLPHYVKYRKALSFHNYQAPELISTKRKYVFPKEQSDLYGICLIIWEMINKIIPFSTTTYADLEKQFIIPVSLLSTVNENHFKIFESIVENGLLINPDERINNCLILEKKLVELREKYLLTNENELDVINIFDPSNDQLIHENRTSTLKKKTVTLQRDRTKSKKLFKRVSNNTDISAVANNSSSTGANISQNAPKEYEKRPIAYNNKILKESWLFHQSSNQENFEYNEQGGRDKNFRNEPLHEQEYVTTGSPGTKKFQLNIKMIRKMDKNLGAVEEDIYSGYLEGCETSFSNEHNNTSANVINQVKFWDTFSRSNEVSPSNDSNEIKNNSENVNKTNRIHSFVTRYDSYNSQQECCQNLPEEFLNELFEKKLKNKSFEDSQWKREKAKCETICSKKNNETSSSVKDVIEKFESFSKISKLSFSTTTPIIKQSSNMENEENNVFGNGDQNFESNLNIELHQRKTTNKNDNQIKTIEISKPSFFGNTSPDLTKFNTQNQNINCLYKISRHSIAGSEIIKKINPFDHNLITPKIQKRRITNKIESVKCWNCGCEVFVNNTGNERLKQNNLISITSLNNFDSYKSLKSVEDLYIDDDFLQDIELGANTELNPCDMDYVCYHTNEQHEDFYVSIN